MGVFSVGEIPKSTIVCDYHGIYLTLREYIKITKKASNKDDEVNKYIHQLPSFTQIMSRKFDKTNFENDPEENILSKFSEEELGLYVVIDGSSKCACHDRRSAGSYINHANSGKQSNVVQKSVQKGGTWIIYFKTTKTIKREIS